jgi:formylglycine-generating enzyme required for sulfatase activity
VKLRGIVVGLAVTGALFSGAWACGSRTGIGLFNEVGGDGDGHDGDALGEDAVVTDGVSGTPCPGAGGSDVPPPPSCAPSGAGMTNCGPGGSGSESCCTSLEVCGGTYYRTYTNDGGGPTQESDPATVSDFRLDKYLVTVGRFRQFVAAWRSGYYPSAGSGIHAYLNGGQGLENNASPGTYETGWDVANWNNATDVDPTDANLGVCSHSSMVSSSTWTAGPAGSENLPMNCVTWYEAYAFCIWDGGFLPSEAEWEYAAAGGSQQREYPWGSAAPGTACPGTGCEYAIYRCYYPSGSGACSGGVTNLATVGYAFAGAGRWGQLDLAGEVSEWILDLPQGFYATDCINCTYTTPETNPFRIVGGGDFAELAVFLLAVPNHQDGYAMARHDGTGFRCARTPRTLPTTTSDE